MLREGAVTPEAMEIASYWGKKTIAGLLLMPPHQALPPASEQGDEDQKGSPEERS